MFKWLKNRLAKVKRQNVLEENGLGHICCCECGKIERRITAMQHGWRLAANKPFQYVCSNECDMKRV